MNQLNGRRMSDDFILDIKELLWRLVEQWKAIFTVAIIVALLFSGIFEVRNASSASNDSTPATREDILNSMSDSDREIVLGILKQTAARDMVQEYIKNSPYMNLDPYSVNCLMMNWAVSSDDSINRQLVAAYMNEIQKDDIAEAVNQAWGNEYKTDDIIDLINVTPDILLENEAELGGNILKLKFYIPEGKDASAASEAIKDYLPGITAKLNSVVGEHQIALIDEQSEAITDVMLSNKQYDILNRFYNLNYQVTYVKTNVLTSSQRSAYEKLKQMNDNEPTEAGSSDEPQPSGLSMRSLLNKKYLAVGFVLGGAVYVGLYLLYFVFSKRIFSSSAIEKGLGIRTLGECYTKKRKGFWGNILCSGYIYKKHHKGHLNPKSEADRVCESIKKAMEGREGDLLLISGSTKSANTEEFIRHLTGKLEENGITAVIDEVDCSEGTYLRETVLSSKAAATMVADKKYSSADDIKEVFDKCIVCEVPLVGAAYVE